MPDPSTLGHLIEGIVEQDPMTEQYVIRTETTEGRVLVVDIQEILAKYNGKEVRFTLASFENLQKLAEMVEQQGNGQVLGIYPDDIQRS
jgi:hypothetical protein